MNADDDQGPSAQNYGTGLAHLVLCGASGWALHETNMDGAPVAYGCFAFLLTHGLMGILHHTHPHLNCRNILSDVYRHSKLLSQICPLALITTQLSLDVGIAPEYAYIHAATALLPTICEIAMPDQNEHALDIVVLGNVGALGYLAATRDRYWAIGLAVLSTINHFGCRAMSDRFDVPRTDLITFGMGFFTVFAVNCLREK